MRANPSARTGMKASGSTSGAARITSKRLLLGSKRRDASRFRRRSTSQPEGASTMATTTPPGRGAAAKRADSVRPPEQGWVVPLSDVRVDEEIEQAAVAAVRSGWWSMGPRVAQLERKFAAFCGVKHAFAAANGTAAPDLAVSAVGCGA